MLKFKNVLTLLVLALLFSFVSSTFAKQLPGDVAGQRADYLYKKLNLTTDQYTKVYQAVLAHVVKCDATCNAKDKKASKDEMKKMCDALNADITKILTKDQVAKFEPMKDKWMHAKLTKKVRKVKTDGTENKDVKKEEKKDVKKDTKKEVKKDVKKEEPKKDVKKEEPKKEEKKK